jgi:hypothetical protein
VERFDESQVHVESGQIRHCTGMSLDEPGEMSMLTDSICSGGRPCSASSAAIVAMALESRPAVTLSTRRWRASAASVM